MNRHTTNISNPALSRPTGLSRPVRRGLGWLAAGLVLGTGAWLLTRPAADIPFVVVGNSPQLYASAGPAASDRIYSPFHLVVDPMERLLLINFTNDPDAVYEGFEPQVFDDTVHGQGMIVIGWRVDGRVDVYHQPGVRLDPKTYDIAGDGLAHMVERPLEDAYFYVTPAGVDAWFAFEDIDGRPIEVTIREENPKAPAPFGLLAPMGDAASSPSAMPLVYLHDFYFVRQSGTTVEVLVDGESRKLDTLPLPMDATRMYFTRYSPAPMIVTLNPAHNGELAALTRVDAGRARQGDLWFDLVDNQGKPEIAQMRHSYLEHEVRVRFSPPLPHLPSLAPDARSRGHFLIEAHASLGTVRGEYSLARDGERITLQMHPSGGWQHNETKWSARLIYRMAGVFARWPMTYLWNAQLDLSDADRVTLESRWVRTE